jgi:hypothetical protein
MDFAAILALRSLISKFQAKESEFYHLKAYSNQFVQFFNHPLTQIGMNSATFAKFPFVRAKILQFKGLFGQLFSFVDKSIEEHNKMIDYEQEEVSAKKGKRLKMDF